MHSLAYFWDVVKFDFIGSMMKKADQKWAKAADLVLHCLQAEAGRRPQSMDQVLKHKFFDPAGKMQFLYDDETWEAFVQRQATDLHAAIKDRNSTQVTKINSKKQFCRK